ncbi:MAG: HD domain-containing protein, partial [Armatimonadota bacterium]|nr:HD domain-containing protein [Armatimonadota bacterium]
YGEHDGRLTLLAIGGYGRSELCPFSDIDIAFVPSEEEHPIIDAVTKEAFRLIVEVMMDGARLDVSYAYRPISDCERLDHTGKAALWDARVIAGSQRLLRILHDEMHHHWDPVEFLLDKARERGDVARRVPLSLYAVEPNLKEGAGALRDIHTALWVAGVLLRTTNPVRTLEWRGIVTADDCAQLMAANDFFLSLRVWLHLTTRRKTDVLREEYQDRCARAFHYTGSGGRAAQLLLADYYRHAEVAARFSEKVMHRLLEGPLQIDHHFVATHRRLNAGHPYTLRNHPELLLAPFAQARKYGFMLDSELERAVQEALPLVTDEARCHQIARAGFFALIHDVETAADALTDLRARGVLQAFMPEFDAILHLAPADPTHQLTVGEHSIFAVRRLGELWRQRDNDAMHAVWDGIDDIELLDLATLLHDIGKMELGTDHSVSGEKIAMKIGERLHLSAERNERLGLLVRRHLLLPRAARLRDLAAPGTIREVMQHAHDVPTLKMLYLLSLADTCAVGERSYSKLDIEAMKELYARALLAMTRAETAAALTDMEQREQMVQRERERIRRELRHLEFDDATLQRLTNNLPASYVLNTPLPTMATHLKFLDQLPQEKLIVDFYRDPHGDFTEMTIVTYDEETPGLLSKICGVVHAAGAEILAAHVYTLRAQDMAGDEPPATTKNGIANAPDGAQPTAPLTRHSALSTQHSLCCDIVLDRLHVVANGRALTESRSARLAALLREVLVGRQSVQDVLQTAGKETAVGIVPERLSARNDLSDEHTVITLVSGNVPGLLYHITRAFAAVGLDIHTAKITTWAGRAEDAFYVTQRSDGHGRKLGDHEIGPELEALQEKLRKPDVGP